MTLQACVHSEGRAHSCIGMTQGLNQMDSVAIRAHRSIGSAQGVRLPVKSPTISLELRRVALTANRGNPPSEVGRTHGAQLSGLVARSTRRGTLQSGPPIASVDTSGKLGDLLRMTPRTKRHFRTGVWSGAPRTSERNILRTRGKRSGGQDSRWSRGFHLIERLRMDHGATATKEEKGEGQQASYIQNPS